METVGENVGRAVIDSVVDEHFSQIFPVELSPGLSFKRCIGVRDAQILNFVTVLILSMELSVESATICPLEAGWAKCGSFHKLTGSFTRSLFDNACVCNQC